jgi:hypothetical protein
MIRCNASFGTYVTGATVIPILKPGKNPAVAENYRPVLASYKVLERIISKWLVHNIEERNLFPSQQYGFKKNRSTIDVLTILENNITEAFRQGQSTAMTSLDISKAYDLRCRYNILKIWKIDRKMLQFISGFVIERTLRVAVGSTLSDERQIENGEV